MSRYVSICGSLAVSVMAACGGSSDGNPPPETATAPMIDATEIRITQQLMSNWQFTQDDAMSDEEALASTRATWQVVHLPHTWNAQDAATYQSPDYKRGLGWYGLQLATPTEGARHWLEFGAASLVADVWLNGQHLGQHKGGATAFRFDVTDYAMSSWRNVHIANLWIETWNGLDSARQASRFEALSNENGETVAIGNQVREGLGLSLFNYMVGGERITKEAGNWRASGPGRLNFDPSLGESWNAE